jgi:hypothetical protein
MKQSQLEIVPVSANALPLGRRFAVASTVDGMVLRRSLIAAGLVAFALTPGASFGQVSPSPTSASVTPAPAASVTPAAAPGSPATGSPAPSASGAATTVDPAIVARAKDWLHRVQTATVDRTQLDDQMNALLTDSLVTQVAAQLGPLGEPSTFTFVDKRSVGTATGYRFLATFKAAKFYELLAINDAGKISGLRFLPAP